MYDGGDSVFPVAGPSGGSLATANDGMLQKIVLVPYRFGGGRQQQQRDRNSFVFNLSEGRDRVISSHPSPHR